MQFRSKPVEYLSHLIGHESEGSILSVLKAKGWANSLSSGVSQSAADFSSFAIDVSLTEEGTKHVDEILQTVFQYIGE